MLKNYFFNEDDFVTNCQAKKSTLFLKYIKLIYNYFATGLAALFLNRSSSS